MSSGASAKITEGRADPALPPMVAPALARPIGFPLRAEACRTITRRRAPRRRSTIDISARAVRRTPVDTGASVLSVDDGSVGYHEPGFFENTDALTIKHSNGLVVRYGEIRARPGHRPDRRQQEGHLDVAHRVLYGFEGRAPIRRVPAPGRVAGAGSPMTILAPAQSITD